MLRECGVLYLPGAFRSYILLVLAYSLLVVIAEIAFQLFLGLYAVIHHQQYGEVLEASGADSCKYLYAQQSSYLCTLGCIVCEELNQCDWYQPAINIYKYKLSSWKLNECWSNNRPFNIVAYWHVVIVLFIFNLLSTTCTYVFWLLISKGCLSALMASEIAFKYVTALLLVNHFMLVDTVGSSWTQGTGLVLNINGPICGLDPAEIIILLKSYSVINGCNIMSWCAFNPVSVDI